MTPATAPIDPDDAPVPRTAATIVVMRETAADPEILMLRRHARSGFAASLWVFPGGVVDRTDGQVPAANWTGIAPVALAPVFDMSAEEVLALHIAAVRETFEEAGVLLAHRVDGAPLDATNDPAFVRMRAELNDRAVVADWPSFLVANNLVLDLDHLAFHSRWITPTAEPRRYDTAFFIARMPADAIAAADNVETTQDRWISAAAALADDDFAMIFPTIRTLEQLRDLGSVEIAMSAARRQATVRPVMPHMTFAEDGTLIGILGPDDPDYPHELYR